MDNTEQSPAAAVDENQIIAERRAKLAALRAQGNAFPNDFRRDALAADLHAQHDAKTNEELEPLAITATVAGRMLLKRVMGKASFATIQDMSGRIQLYVTSDAVGADVHDAFKHWDLGDLVGADRPRVQDPDRRAFAQGDVAAPAREGAAAAAREVPRAVRPGAALPAALRRPHHESGVARGLQAALADRAGDPRVLRRPRLSRGRDADDAPIPGGAAARPFATHHNALDMELFLRIAPELYLKKLVVGGMEKVFEINRNFRNEGISTRHNPEFTMLEFYEAYQDYRYLMDLTEALFREVAQKVVGTTTVTYQGVAIDLGKPFDRLTMAEAIHKYNPRYPLAELAKPEYLKVALAPLDVEVFATDGVGLLQLKLFEATTEDKLVQPTFIVAHPTDVSPLARANDANPAVTDRFELFITGRELANGFSELNDPEDQAARFRGQVEAREAGDEEAMYYDADYIRAMEYGLPPTAGEGIGIDRLVMLLTDSPSIRDVILFPQLKREG